MLGARHDLDPNHCFHGDLGLVAIYDEALTAVEVLLRRGSRPPRAEQHSSSQRLWQGGMDRDGTGELAWYMYTPHDLSVCLPMNDHRMRRMADISKVQACGRWLGS